MIGAPSGEFRLIGQETIAVFARCGPILTPAKVSVPRTLANPGDHGVSEFREKERQNLENAH